MLGRREEERGESEALQKLAVPLPSWSASPPRG
jgi:hypothetical protein